MKFDLVIHNAVIVTVNPDFDIIPNGVIGINGGLSAFYKNHSSFMIFIILSSMQERRKVFIGF